MHHDLNQVGNLLGRMGAKYIFTSFGEVYTGFEFDLHDKPGRAVIVQNDHLKDYNALSDGERTIEKLSQYGWIVSKAAIIDRIPFGDIIKPSRKDNGIWFDGSYRKEMFIFGAGASANCVVGEAKDEFLACAFRPPLGNDLFARRFREFQKQYEGVKQSIAELQQGSVEEFLESEWKDMETGNIIVMNRHMNIQFYLQKILMEISRFVCDEYFDSNLYSILARKLQLLNGSHPQRRFAVVSFNQDTILEHFFSLQFKYAIKSMEDYIDVNNRPVAFFKPHGSWNWGWKFPKHRENMSAWLFQNNFHFYHLYFQLLGTPTQMIDWNSYGVEAANHDHQIGKFTIDKSLLEIIPEKQCNQYYPGLLLPYRDKDEFTFPLKHYHCLSGYLGFVETLYIVGWKGNERAFIRLLRHHAHSIKRIVIADPNPSNVESNLSAVISKCKPQMTYYKDFEDFVANCALLS